MTDLGLVQGSFWYTGNGTDDASIKQSLATQNVTPKDKDFYLAHTTGQIFQYSKADNTWSVTLQINFINEAGGVVNVNSQPNFVSTSATILATQTDKGVAFATDNGYLYFWDGTKYVQGNLYQAPVALNVVIPESQQVVQSSGIRLDSDSIAKPKINNPSNMIEFQVSDRYEGDGYLLEVDRVSGSIHIKVSSTDNYTTPICFRFHLPIVSNMRNIATVTGQGNGYFALWALENYVSYTRGSGDLVALCGAVLNGSTYQNHVSLSTNITTTVEMNSIQVRFGSGESAFSGDIWVTPYVGLYPEANNNYTSRITYDLNPSITISQESLPPTQVTPEEFQESVNTTSYVNQIWKKAIINEQLKNDFAWKDPDKIYVAFTFDDNRSDMDSIETLFEQEGVPCCFATIPNRLDNTTSGGETVRQVLDRCVANGGEVLAHWDSPLTSSSPYSDYVEVYEGAHKTLTEAGYDVNGIITAGGTNFQTQNHVWDVQLARPIYRYGDYTDRGGTVMQYNWARVFLEGNPTKVISDMQTKLNNISNLHYQDKIIIHASNGSDDGDTTANIKQIIDFYKEHSDQIVITSVKDIFDKFGGSKLGKAISDLQGNEYYTN